MDKNSMCKCGHSYDEHYTLAEEPEDCSCLHRTGDFKEYNYCNCMMFEMATDQDLLNAALRLHNAASIIFLVSSRSGRNGEACPHGNYPGYPTHAWWCDGCFHELEDALEEVTCLLNKE